MHDELSQFRTTFVRVPSMPDEKFCQITELFDREISGERCLSSFLSNDTDTNVGGLDHGDVVATIADTADALLGVLADEPGYICFLRWGTTACNDGRKLDGDGDEVVTVVLKEEGE